MALFGFKKDTEKTSSAKATEIKKATSTKVAKPAVKVAKPKAIKAVKTPAASTTAVSVPTSGSHGAGFILRPRITEKSGLLSQSGVYTFEIATNANKNSVASAIKALYKVTPIKVAILNNPAKNVFVRGHRGVVSGVRKALVTLKKGEKIDFV